MDNVASNKDRRQKQEKKRARVSKRETERHREKGSEK